MKEQRSKDTFKYIACKYLGKGKGGFLRLFHSDSRQERLDLNNLARANQNP